MLLFIWKSSWVFLSTYMHIYNIGIKPNITRKKTYITLESKTKKLLWKSYCNLYIDYIYYFILLQKLYSYIWIWDAAHRFIIFLFVDYTYTDQYRHCKWRCVQSSIGFQGPLPTMRCHVNHYETHQSSILVKIQINVIVM